MKLPYESILALSEKELTLAYFRDERAILENAWWFRRWQWSYSTGWKLCCLEHEAMCLLAWEADPPALPVEDEWVFHSLTWLNAYARTLDYPSRTLRKQIYWLKNRAVEEAANRGLAFLRLVESMVSCNGCGGTGVYQGWAFDPHSDDPPCRRCGATGKVQLRFIEVNIANRYVFHQPFDHTNPFRTESVSHLQPHSATTWSPNQPGRAMHWWDAHQYVTRLKRRYWDPQPNYVKQIYTFMEK